MRFVLFLNVVMIAARVRGALVTTTKNGGIESFEINVWENYFKISDFSLF